MTVYDELTDFCHFNILKTIIMEPKNLTDIANLLNISKPEVSRHLARLRELQLTKKDENLNKITVLGELILEILSPLEFIIKFYEFFKTHPFFNFPSELLYRISCFQESQLMVGTGYIFQKVLEITKKEHNKLKLMINTPMPNITDYIFEEGHLIVPLERPPQTLLHEKVSKDFKRYEYRKLTEINYGILILNDKCGFLNFPDNDGIVDFNSCFFIENKEGMAFLLTLWNYYWERSQVVLKST